MSGEDLEGAIGEAGGGEAETTRENGRDEGDLGAAGEESGSGRAPGGLGAERDEGAGMTGAATPTADVEGESAGP